MSSLLNTLDEYLTLRWKLGFALEEHEAALKKFIGFLEDRGAHHITVELALQWAQQPCGITQARQATRLGMVHDFARYVLDSDPLTTVPPKGLLPSTTNRPMPYIYTADQIVALVGGAADLHPHDGLKLRPHTYATLFGLIAVTGMRVSEALALDCRDVDLTRGVVTVRESKFRKTRLLPVHESTQARLREYASRRDKCIRATPSDCFFVADRRTRLHPVPVNNTFILISRRIGLRQVGDSHGPRVHDLRHTFAVRVLTDWYRSGGDPARCLPLLASYMGHSNINSTYWYLSATPDLLGAANSRLERFMGGRI